MAECWTVTAIGKLFVSRSRGCCHSFIGRKNGLKPLATLKVDVRITDDSSVAATRLRRDRSARAGFILSGRLCSSERSGRGYRSVLSTDAYLVEPSQVGLRGWARGVLLPTKGAALSDSLEAVKKKAGVRCVQSRCQVSD